MEGTYLRTTAVEVVDKVRGIVERKSSFGPGGTGVEGGDDIVVGCRSSNGNCWCCGDEVKSAEQNGC